jgi:excisionase family DNA binding protein
MIGSTLFLIPPVGKWTKLCTLPKRRREQMTQQVLSELLTVAEVARILRVDDTTVRRWVKQGVLEAVVLPHVNTRQGYRIKRETLNKLLGESGATAE